MTNGDKIRAMTDEELLEFLIDSDFNFCEDCINRCTCGDYEGCREAMLILNWLKERVNDGKDC